MYMPKSFVIERQKILLQRAKKEQYKETDKNETPKFVPNPGSQQELFFDKLGIKKGRPLDRNIRGKLTQIPTIDPTGWQYEKGKKALLYLGGFGTGKSYAGAAFCYACSVAYKTRGLIVANDYEQLRRSTIYKMVEFCEVHGIPFSPQKETIEGSAIAIARQNKYMIINGMYFDVVTAQSFQDQTSKSKVSGMGAEYGIAWFDEGLFADVSVPSAIITRLRCQNAPNLLLITSTINWNQPLNWGYEWFADGDRTVGQRESFDMVVGTTDENYHNPESYYNELQATRTPELFAIQVLAQFKDITVGKIAYYFNREIHVGTFKFDDRYPICVSFDFNVNPAVGLIFQYIDGVVYFLKEVYQMSSDTFRSSAEILRLVQLMGVPSGRSINIYGDATGNNRTANAINSNWQIVTNTLAQQYSPICKFGNINPPVIARCHSFNFAFFKDLIRIDSSCKMLIKDITSVAWNADGSDIDKKSNPLISHLFDAASYPIYQLIPHGGNGSHGGMSKYRSGAI